MELLPSSGVKPCLLWWWWWAAGGNTKNYPGLCTPQEPWLGKLLTFVSLPNPAIHDSACSPTRCALRDRKQDVKDRQTTKSHCPARSCRPQCALRDRKQDVKDRQTTKSHCPIRSCRSQWTPPLQALAVHQWRSEPPPPKVCLLFRRFSVPGPSRLCCPLHRELEALQHDRL